jgi:glycine cleavage system H protein
MVAIFVLLTILTFVGFEYMRRRSIVPIPVPVSKSPERFFLPKGFFIGKNHQWVQLTYGGEARIGMDDFLQKIVGTIDKIEVAPMNAEIKKGEPLVRISHGTRTLVIPAPISGRVARVNEDVVRFPKAIHEDPYVRGWVADIAPADLAGDVKSLSIADEAAKWLRAEVSRFRDFIRAEATAAMPAPAGVTLLDGGMPLGAVLEQFNEKTWKSFENEFLTSPRS